jgi:POT family proton-dependent oligopeptide transporter
MNGPITDTPDRPKDFGFIFWVANWMEIVERFAYYGVRVVLPIFMIEAISDGGPEFDHIQKGTIYAIWALVQSFVPIFSGGFADRYGFKVNIAISTILKIIGYFVMGYAVSIGELFAGMPLSEARPLQADYTYEIFFAGAMFLALGTAIFKPGLQGLIAHQMPKGKESFGWGIFYQMVNIGAFIGPMLAGWLRAEVSWNAVFLTCSAVIALNFIPLFIFKEPASMDRSDGKSAWDVIKDAFVGLLEPRLFFFTISFAGFWLMFFQLFDILPNFIDDWVDSRDLANWLGGEGVVPTINGGNLTQEWIINFNALLISFFAFAMGWLTGKIKSLNAIVIGILVSAIAIYALGMSENGWWCLAAIGLFSIGEMTASPTKMRYLGGIAPKGKEGLYMGYVNFTVGIGWSIGSTIAGNLYETGGDKINLAKKYLIENQGLAKEAIPKDRAEVLPFFSEQTGLDPWQTRATLWEAYEPYSMWAIFAFIGLGSMIALMIYNKVVTAASKDANHKFNLKGQDYVTFSLIPISLAFWWGAARLDWNDKAIIVQAILFSALAATSFYLQQNRKNS